MSVDSFWKKYAGEYTPADLGVPKVEFAEYFSKFIFEMKLLGDPLSDRQIEIILVEIHSNLQYGEKSMLTLRDCIKKIIPRSLIELASLFDGLRIDGSLLKELPDFFSEINILNLEISGAHFTELPAVITRMCFLHSLKISLTMISGLPSSLARLKNLHALHLHNNPIVGIPDVIFELKSLRILRFISSVTFVPEGIVSLHNLKELSLANNHLKELPETLSRLRMLEFIDISHNLFSVFPDVLTRMYNLRTIRISNNQLYSVPDLSMLYELRGIDLSDNPISELSVIPQLKYINLINTQVSKSNINAFVARGIEVNRLKI